MDLATVRPTQPDPVWAAVATGMYPAKNGVRSHRSYSRSRRRPAARAAARLLLLARAGPLGLRAARAELVGDRCAARPLWSILADAGIVSRRRPLAADVSGAAGRGLRADAIGFTSSSDRRCELDEQRRVSAEAVCRSRATRLCRRRRCRMAWRLPVATGDATADARGIAGPARSRSTALRCASSRPRGRCSFSALRYQGLDTVGHYNLRYTQPRDVRRGDEDERRRRLQVSTATTATSTTRSAGARRARARRSAARRLRLRHAAPNAVKRLLARVLRRSDERHARARARRLSARLRHRGRARPPPARLDRRRHADRAVLPGPARRPRHGRLRAYGSLPTHAEPVVTDARADRVHAVAHTRYMAAERGNAVRQDLRRLRRLSPASRPIM